MSDTPETPEQQNHPEPQIDSTGTPYRVDLDSYSGPLDLLLYLIRKDEVDIYDIPISRIAEQYQQYVEVIAAVNVNMAGEFLVMAATLMEIKSRLLLPTETGKVDDEEDPRAELVRQLLEYKRYRDFAHELGKRAQEQSLKFARPAAATKPVDSGEQVNPLDGIGLWELIEAFAKVLSETGADIDKTSLLVRQRPIHEYRRDLLRMVSATGTLLFREVFKECKTRDDLIAMFIAALELIRLKLVRAQQTAEFGELYLIATSEEEATQQAVAIAEQPDAPEEPKPKKKDDFTKTIKRPDMIKEVDVLAELMDEDDSLGKARERIDGAIASVEAFLKMHHDQMKAAIEGEQESPEPSPAEQPPAENQTAAAQEAKPETAPAEIPQIPPEQQPASQSGTEEAKENRL